jgi:chromosome partitioning protein
MPQPNQPNILAFTMQKGGVGKTTTTLNLGVGLAQRGKRVLLIDIDPQADLTQGLGFDPTELEYSVYEVLLNPDHGVGFATLHTEIGVDLVPATIALAGAELELAGKVARELLLRDAIRATGQEYDYILIDPPPSLGLFTLNAMATATSLIVPLQTHVFAYKALPVLESAINLVKKLNPPLEIGGIVCTMVDKRTNLSQVIENRAREEYSGRVLKTTIPYNIRSAEAPAAGKPLILYAPEAPAALAYTALAKEVEERYAK